MAQRDPFDDWYETLQRRHLAELSFAEVRRALQALSARYVEGRASLGGRDPLGSAGKRAAYALFYGPLHFLLIGRIVRELGAARRAAGTLVDLGCGSGAAGAAWALQAARRPRIVGVDRNAWALQEARRTWSDLGLRGRTRRGDLGAAPVPRGADVVVAFAANELPPSARAALLERLLDLAGRRSRVLVVEPLSRRAVPWWSEWAERFAASGGRADQWKFTARLPERLRLLDRAAGLDHRRLGGRSLWLAAAARP